MAPGSLAFVRSRGSEAVAEQQHHALGARHARASLRPGPQARRGGERIGARFGWITSVLGIAALVAPAAQAQESRPVSTARAPRLPPELAPVREPSILELAANLPPAAPLLVYAPTAAGLLDDFEELLALASKLDPQLSPARLPATLHAALWGERRGPSLRFAGPEQAASLARLFDARALAELGVDGGAPVMLVPANEALLLGLGLTDSERFARWLGQTFGAARTLAVGREEALVLAADSETPLACLVRAAAALCQIGVVRGQDPLALLRHLGQPRPVPAARLSGLVRASEALPSGARARIVINTLALAEQAAEGAAERERRAHRFEPPDRRRQSEERARARAKEIRRVVSLAEGAAAGIYAEQGGLAVRLETALSPQGARLVRENLQNRPPDPRIARWSRTPALFRVLANVDPGLLEQVAQGLGIPLPASALDGTVALLTLGLDSECPLAKKRAEQASSDLSWVFLLPTTIAVGLTGDTAADALHQRLDEDLTAAEAPKAPALAGSPRPPLLGRAFGSPYEVHVLDEVLLFGAGPGMGAAAKRRLASLREDGAARESSTFLEATLHLRAVNAAFSSASLGRDHRPELMALEALRLELAPLVQRFDRVSLSAEAPDGGRRVRVELRVAQ